MDKKPFSRWGMHETPPLGGDPFALARSSCRHAVQIAQNVFLDESRLRRFADELDLATIRNIPHESLGENCDTVSDDFRGANEAANFALLFCLLQFGHALHQHCGRGASQTITLGIRTLHQSGDLSAAYLNRLTASDVHTQDTIFY
jgi:hypothetical protein